MKKCKEPFKDARSQLMPLLKARLEEVSGGYYVLREHLKSSPSRYDVHIWGWFEGKAYGDSADEAVMIALENGSTGNWEREVEP